MSRVKVSAKTIYIDELIIKQVGKIALEEYPKASGKTGNFSLATRKLISEALEARKTK
jgi:hypothetical protein